MLSTDDDRQQGNELTSLLVPPSQRRKTHSFQNATRVQEESICRTAGNAPNQNTIETRNPQSPMAILRLFHRLNKMNTELLARIRPNLPCPPAEIGHDLPPLAMAQDPRIAGSFDRRFVDRSARR